MGSDGVIAFQLKSKRKEKKGKRRELERIVHHADTDRNQKGNTNDDDDYIHTLAIDTYYYSLIGSFGSVTVSS